jgi:hypothetical protein
MEASDFGIEAILSKKFVESKIHPCIVHPRIFSPADVTGVF